MYRIIFKLFIAFSIVSPSFPIQKNYRKYNVNEESFKLYGEDFKSVLKRFRRTPDYLKILQDKVNDLMISTKEMSLQIFNYHHDKLRKRVEDIYPTTTTTEAGAPPVILEDQKDKVYFHAARGRYGLRRQDEPTTQAETSSEKIHNLDNYKVFTAELSVAERNSLKDLGFEYAGKIVHSLIKNMDPKEAEGMTEKFTEGLSDDNVATTTTSTHPPEHAVRHGTLREDDAETVPTDESPSTEAYSNKHEQYKKHKIYWNELG